MLEDIADVEGSARAFLEKTKDTNDTTRLMGFGHRVYKNYDPARLDPQAPRARGDRAARPLAAVAGRSRSNSRTSRSTTTTTCSASSTRTWTFYSGLIYEALGVPKNGSTALFALGRMPGWIAHWREHHDDSRNRLNRPRQIYTGPTTRSYVPMEER